MSLLSCAIMAFSRLHFQTPLPSPSSNSSSIVQIPTTLGPLIHLPLPSSLISLRFNSNRNNNNRRCVLPRFALDSPPALSPTYSARSKGDESSPQLLLQVKDLTAVIAESKQQVLKGVNLVIRQGEVHAIMGKNGSGKSTLSKVLVGHPDYEVTGGSAIFKGENLFDMEPEERSLSGLFMSFQSPVEIPGVSNMDFLQMAYNARRKKLGLQELDPIQFYSFLIPKLAAVKMDTGFLNRNVNEGFSGGEKKRNEILQLAVLGADLAILDEIDSGLDVDELQDVARAVNALLSPERSVLMVTHYQRLLDCINPKYVHIMEDGRIVKTGDISIAKLLEKEGYKGLSSA